MNPLLHSAELPAFNKISPADISPAIDQVLADNRARLQQLCEDQNEPDWDSLC